MSSKEGEMGFREADRRYDELKRQYEARDLTNKDFDAELRRLMVQDNEGRWWAKSRESGRWYYYDGDAWVAGTPPIYQTAPQTLPTEPVQDHRSQPEQNKQVPLPQTTSTDGSSTDIQSRDVRPERRDPGKQKALFGAVAAAVAGVTWMMAGILGITHIGLLPVMMSILALISTVGGLAGLHIWRVTSYGRLGLAGFLAVSTGTVLVLIGFMFSASQSLLKLGLSGMAVGFMLLGLGLVLSMIAIRRARALPRRRGFLRWGGFLLRWGGLLFVPIITGIFGLASYFTVEIRPLGAGIVLGPLWLALGYVLWSQRGSAANLRLQPQQVAPLPWEGQRQEFSLMAAVFTALGIFGSVGLSLLVATPVPDLRGNTLDEALEEIRGTNFEVLYASRITASGQPRGTIIEQEFGTGEDVFFTDQGIIRFDKGERPTITLTFSGGRERVEVPDVSGSRKPQAMQVLLEAGLDIEAPDKVKFDRSGKPTTIRGDDQETVTATDPSAGETVNPGTQVELNPQ